jgi:hypothetical protein
MKTLDTCCEQVGRRGKDCERSFLPLRRSVGRLQQNEPQSLRFKIVFKVGWGGAKDLTPPHGRRKAMCVTELAINFIIACNMSDPLRDGVMQLSPAFSETGCGLGCEHGNQLSPCT